MIPRYLRVVGASLSDTKLYTALNQTVLSIQSWKLCCFFSGFGGGSWEPEHLGVDMLQSKVIHRPGFCTVQMGFRSASQNFVMFMVWILTPSYHCKQLHADTHSARSCAHSCMHKVRLALKTWLQVCAHVGGQQRASQDSHTDPQSAAPPPAWLVVARVLPPAVCQQAG